MYRAQGSEHTQRSWATRAACGLHAVSRATAARERPLLMVRTWTIPNGPVRTLNAPSWGRGMMAYIARLKYIMGMRDPTLLFMDKDGIEQARKLVQASNADPETTGVSGRMVARARRVVDDAVHPITGDVIPSFVRQSSTAPVNIMLGAAMISTSSVPITAFLHVYYQTHASLVRYANHSDADHPMNSQRLWTTYFAATATALGIGVGATWALRFSPRRLRPLGVMAPHAAVGSAGAIGLYRHNEHYAHDGVEIIDDTGARVGTSVAAGRSLLRDAIFLHSFVLPTFQLLLPPLLVRYALMPRFAVLSGLQRYTLVFPIALGTTAVCVLGLTPCAMACFPRHKALEPWHVADVRLKDGTRALEPGTLPKPLYASKPLY